MVSRVREGVCVGGDKREMDVVTKEHTRAFGGGRIFLFPEFFGEYMNLNVIKMYRTIHTSTIPICTCAHIHTHTYMHAHADI